MTICYHWGNKTHTHTHKLTERERERKNRIHGEIVEIIKLVEEEQKEEREKKSTSFNNNYDNDTWARKTITICDSLTTANISKHKKKKTKRK